MLTFSLIHLPIAFLCGYMNDFAFFESGKQDDAPPANPIAEKLTVFTAQGPERMLHYLSYNGMGGRKVENNRMLMEVMIDGKPYAAVSVPTENEVAPGLIIWTLMESLRVGTLVAIEHAIEQANGVYSGVSVYTNVNYIILGGLVVDKYDI
ncbi:hypothetical protein BGZ47_005994 [Haplosporangium gracile]|nr:hypothetical protein BGZ47_005994 [Haplosporangium gracile]